MSVRKYSGKRGTTWHVILELGRDANDRRQQEVIRKDPETGLRIPTKKRALEIERAERVRRHRGTVIDPDTTLLRDFLTRWLEETRDSRRESTHYNWTNIVTVRIAPSTIGAIALSRLDSLSIESFYREQAKRYAHGSLSSTHTVLSGALKAAVRWRLLERSPLEGVQLPKGRGPSTRVVWTPAEARAFLAATEGSRWGALWRLLLDSGMRIGEALALTWADLDTASGTVRVGKTVALDGGGRRVIAERTKSASSRRTVALSPATLSALQRHRVRQLERRLELGEFWRDTDLIFDRHDGGLMDATLLRRHLRRDIAQAGVPQITPHGLRHTSATLAVAVGEPLHAISKRLGHGTLAMTSDLYAHFSREADQRVSQALDRILGG